jgi:hypothetical protein
MCTECVATKKNKREAIKKRKRKNMASSSEFGSKIHQMNICLHSQLNKKIQKYLNIIGKLRDYLHSHKDSLGIVYYFMEFWSLYSPNTRGRYQIDSKAKKFYDQVIKPFLPPEHIIIEQYRLKKKDCFIRDQPSTLFYISCDFMRDGDYQHFVDQFSQCHNQEFPCTTLVFISDEYDQYETKMELKTFRQVLDYDCLSSNDCAFKEIHIL